MMIDAVDQISDKS